MIVVDLGCHGHGRYDSVGALIEHFKPALLYGFDPHPETPESVNVRLGTTVVISRQAAWTRAGQIPLHVNGTGSALADEGQLVPAFDFCAWLRTLPAGELVVKMDVEGAEYALAHKLRRTRTDERLTLLLVETHAGPLPRLRCPVEEWWM